MSHTIYTAYAALQSRGEALDVVSNNLANIHTPGFKEKQFHFRSLVGRMASEMSGLGSAISAQQVKTFTHSEFQPGVLTETGNPLDLALEGDGFFAVRTPDGTYYTRNGHFSLSPNGTLTTPDGYPVVSAAGRPIVLPDGRVEVSENGQISVDGIQTAQLQIVSFPDVRQLTPVGESLFSPPQGVQPLPPARVAVLQGRLEESNVDPLKNVARMVALVRSFEMLTQAVRSLTRDIDGKLINEVGRI
ncbi:MAG: flagellar basal-body rod protein FlgF [Acidobacteriota bacterium]